MASTTFLSSIGRDVTKRSAQSAGKYVMTTLDLFRHDFVVSIKPEYATRIVEGLKTVELRRRFPYGTVTGAQLFIYASAPIQAVIGYATINVVERLDVAEIWERYRSVACIADEDFQEYFKGRKSGYVIRLKNAVKLECAIELSVLKTQLNFTPPQSFAYADDALKSLVLGS